MKDAQLAEGASLVVVPPSRREQGAARLTGERTPRASPWLRTLPFAELASHDELMASKGFYYALYMSQFKGKGPGGDPDEIALEFVST